MKGSGDWIHGGKPGFGHRQRLREIELEQVEDRNDAVDREAEDARTAVFNGFVQARPVDEFWSPRANPGQGGVSLVPIAGELAKFTDRVPNVAQGELEFSRDGELGRVGPWFVAFDQVVVEVAGAIEDEEDLALVVAGEDVADGGGIAADRRVVPIVFDLRAAIFVEVVESRVAECCL